MGRFEKCMVSGVAVVLALAVVVLLLGLTGCSAPVEATAAGEGITGEWVAAIVGVILSLALEVVPGLAERWQGLDSTWQRLAWLGGCVGVPLVVLGLGCVGVEVGVEGFVCGAAGVVAALRVGFAAYFAGQMTYLAVGRGRRK